MIYLVASIVAGLMLVVVIRHSGLFSPLAVLAAFPPLNLLAYWLVAVMSVYSARGAHLWEYTRAFRTDDPKVAVLYLGIQAILLAVAVRYPRRIESPAAAAQLEVLRSLARRRSVTFFMLGGLLLSLVHAVAVDWSLLVETGTYLLARDPVAARVDLPVLGAFHRNLPIVGVIACGAAVLFWRWRDPLRLALTGPVALYAVVQTLAFGSRFVLVQILAVAAVAWVVEVRGRRLVLMGSVLVVIVLFPSIMDLRLGNRFGLAPTAQLLTSRPLPSVEYYGTFPLTNMANGIFVTAAASERGTPSYPMAYKLLSFSPLPSAVDGFRQVRDQEVRINRFIPLNAFAEAWYFGWAFFLLLLAGMTGCVLQMQKLWRDRADGIAWVVCLPGVYACLAMNSYQVRGIWRWLLISGLAAWAVRWITERRTPREAGP